MKSYAQRGEMRLRLPTGVCSASATANIFTVLVNERWLSVLCDCGRFECTTENTLTRSRVRPLKKIGFFNTEK